MEVDWSDQFKKDWIREQAAGRDMSIPEGVIARLGAEDGTIGEDFTIYHELRFSQEYDTLYLIPRIWAMVYISSDKICLVRMGNPGNIWH